jgi:cytochrome c553
MNCPHGIDVEKFCDRCDELMGRAWDILRNVAACEHPEIAVSHTDPLDVCLVCGAAKFNDEPSEWNPPLWARKAKELEAELQAMGAVPRKGLSS